MAVHCRCRGVEPERATEWRAAHRRRARRRRRSSIEGNPGRVESRPQPAHRPRGRTHPDIDAGGLRRRHPRFRPSVTGKRRWRSRERRRVRRVPFLQARVRARLTAQPDPRTGAVNCIRRTLEPLDFGVPDTNLSDRVAGAVSIEVVGRKVSKNQGRTAPARVRFRPRAGHASRKSRSWRSVDINLSKPRARADNEPVPNPAPKASTARWCWPVTGAAPELARTGPVPKPWAIGPWSGASAKPAGGREWFEAAT